MADDHDPSTRQRERENALHMGPRKKACLSDPLVHHGHHFGRTVHTLTNVQALITNGLLRMSELAEQPEDMFTNEERREHKIFVTLLQMIPGLEERLINGSEEEVAVVASLIQKGAASARSDDTKSLKGAILDWITSKGQSLYPPLSRNVKVDRGFHHERTGSLLCPAGMDWSNDETKQLLRDGETVISGDQWPIFLYRNSIYDAEDPWNGLFRSGLLVSVYKHIFTSPSSVEREPKATRAGNARIHGMTKVTPASIGYVATQVRFALSSSPVFSRTDTATDSERFYNSILDLFEDVDEQEEVNELLLWWNRQVFPNSSTARRPVSKNSALAKIRERRAALKATAIASGSSR
ncbi:hypothetical protein SCP_1701140 [Sparassis crispa]|uniref:Uncharacterized protein n=1 Tax=Sparassis crispa TaxID=139825 RepID=A0A401H5X6_9APHY|nr:hypothetical protein SCP_1701140 [Sparassis crispa]GBE89789.1 hypothetical protein SCP_1701140 [Sparassis crispa]